MDMQKIIHDALHEFIQPYLPQAGVGLLDEVILSYITGVLEDLGSQESVEDNFDVEVFVEMLEAYIPGFSDIDSVKVCEMMFSLALKLASARDTGSGEMEIKDNKCLFSENAALTQETTPRLASQAEGATAGVTGCVWDNLEQHLLEMFPKCSVTEARSALSIAKGDMEEAVQLIIEGDVQLEGPSSLNTNQGKITSAEVDQKLKASILDKYMLVDNEEDKKVHRPVTPKDAPKKLVRYHGNQVVTTKGERYQTIKTEENENMKKTYVNLKPARKYRFH